jgi:cell filamentation protein
MKPQLMDSPFDEKHSVLKNKLGLTDGVTLTRKISEYASGRLLLLIEMPLPGNFDIAHLHAIHRYIFQDVFPWAGDFREVTTSRTGSFGFPPPQFILPSLKNLFAALKAEAHLRGLDRDRFALRAGIIWVRSTPSMRFAKAMGARSGSSFVRWR